MNKDTFNICARCSKVFIRPRPKGLNGCPSCDFAYYQCSAVFDTYSEIFTAYLKYYINKIKEGVYK